MTRKANGWEPTGFGSALRRERARAGLSREQLAVNAGCAFQTLVKLECGYQEPSWPMALALARAMNVGVEVFADIDPEDIEPNPPQGRPRKPVVPQEEGEDEKRPRGRPRGS